MHQRRHEVFQRHRVSVQKVAQDAGPLSSITPYAHEQDLPYFNLAFY